MISNSIEQPTIQISSAIKNAIDAKIKEESQVIIHCTYSESTVDSTIRIWPTTYLYEHNNNNRSSLIHAENISIMPWWTYVPAFKPYRFTLYFSGLSKECTTFDLIEEIPEPGAFIVRGIQRNNEDIYHVFI